MLLFWNCCKIKKKNDGDIGERNIDERIVFLWILLQDVSEVLL